LEADFSLQYIGKLILAQKFIKLSSIYIGLECTMILERINEGVDII
jgi:hypothetical protein